MDPAYIYFQDFTEKFSPKQLQKLLLPCSGCMYLASLHADIEVKAVEDGHHLLHYPHPIYTLLNGVLVVIVLTWVLGEYLLWLTSSCNHRIILQAIALDHNVLLFISMQG